MKYNEKIIDFFKRHNMYEDSMFEYLQNHSIMIDYKDMEQRDFIGFFYVTDRGILKSFTICVPYVYDYKTMLISIHEITHGIYAYRRLNKKFNPGVGIEALPILFEKIYILENESEELKKYGEYLDSAINDDSEEKYKFALRNRDKFLSMYDNNYERIERQVDAYTKCEELKLKLSKYFKS